jgi:hypothetical protein
MWAQSVRPLGPMQLVHACEIPCRVGYRAAWDTVPRGIPCRVGYRAAWDSAALRGLQLSPFDYGTDALEQAAQLGSLPKARRCRTRCAARSRERAVFPCQRPNGLLRTSHALAAPLPPPRAPPHAWGRHRVAAAAAVEICHATLLSGTAAHHRLPRR